MANYKNSFVLNTDIAYTIRILSNEQSGILFKHILNYIQGEHNDLEDKLLQIAFVNIERKLLEDNPNLRPTFLYCIVLESEHEKFIKIGISYNPKKRYIHFKTFGYTVTEIFRHEFGTKNRAEYEEFLFKEIYFESKYRPLKSFGGKTECFYMEIKDNVLEKYCNG